jgi:hypothetical protein
LREETVRTAPLIAGLGLVCLCTAASAEPTDDVPGWAQRFTQAALKSDPDVIVQIIAEISDPRLNINGLKAVIQGALKVIGPEIPEYSEQFGEKDVGSFAKRINVSVRYSNNFLFYSVVLARGQRGWQLVQVSIDGNLNKILDAPWPT